MPLKSKEIFFLSILYACSVAIRLWPRLGIDPHLLTFDADIWYRLCLAQFVVDNGHLPVWDIRYAAFGNVPFWYNPLAVYFYATVNFLTSLDLPTIVSRIMPFVESTAIIPFYFLAKYLYNMRVAVMAAIVLALTPAFIFWSSIGTPQGFTMFCIPLGILLWVAFLQKKYIFSNAWVHFILFVGLLTVNFLTHLTYFNHIIILLFVHFSLVRDKIGTYKQFLLLVAAIVLSQLFTMWWWLPTNLYWWWTQGLSTSTASPDRILFLKHFGGITGVIGHLAFFFVFVYSFRKKKSKEVFFLLPIYWACYPLIESHMEGILLLTQRNDLVFNNLVRPIEGFRFYSFLAQPLALCVALMLDRVIQSKLLQATKISVQKICYVVMICLGLALVVDLYSGFQINKRYRSHMLSLNDINAAYWYKQNSLASDRVAADYYSAQMFSGICAGRALLGSMFPLKGANIPYISDSWQVLEDIHQIYKTEDPLLVKEILERYQVTHVLYSDHVLRKVELVLNGYGDMDGYRGGKYDVLKQVDHTKTLLNPDYFQVVYTQGDVRILAAK